MRSKVKDSSVSPTTINDISTQSSPGLSTLVISLPESPHKFSNPIDIFPKSSIKSFKSVKIINTLEITSPLLNSANKYLNPTTQSNHCTSDLEDSKSWFKLFAISM